MTEYCIKLMTSKMTTHGGYQWALGEKRETSGKGPLCGQGWLHGYRITGSEKGAVAKALLLNPIHANLGSPRIFVCEVGGKRKDDGELKSGWTQMTPVREITSPKFPLWRKVWAALLFAEAVAVDKSLMRQVRAAVIPVIVAQKRPYVSNAPTPRGCVMRSKKTPQLAGVRAGSAHEATISICATGALGAIRRRYLPEHRNLCCVTWLGFAPDEAFPNGR